MQPHLLILFALCTVPAMIAAEPAAMVPPIPQNAPRAWLGLDVSKPDPMVTAQLPTLPPGIGFVVRSIDSNGPAAAAGLQEFDILWKIGDQMLVNEGQLAALLRLNQPGDEITLSGFRAGQPQTFIVKLGSIPAGSPPFPDDLVDATILPGACGGPMRVVNRSEKLASYTNSEGTAEVRRVNGSHHITIRDADDELIYQGEITSDYGIKDVPREWRRRVGALRRGLDHVLDGHLDSQRQPRPRVVPPASSDAPP